jgi:hypothetical protein
MMMKGAVTVKVLMNPRLKKEKGSQPANAMRRCGSEADNAPLPVTQKPIMIR